MLDWAVEQNEHPVAIRIPVGPLHETGVADTTDYSILNKNQVTQKGSKVSLFGLGNFYGLAKEVAKELADKHGITATLVNPKFITGLDEELLDSLESEHQVCGDFWKMASLKVAMVRWLQAILEIQTSRFKITVLKKPYHDRYNAKKLLAENGVTVDNIVKNILASLA